MLENANGVLPRWFLLSQMEISCHILKMAIFSKFFGNLITHLTREYAIKKYNHFWMFTIKNHGYTFVCFYGIQSLLVVLWHSIAHKSIKTSLFTDFSSSVPPKLYVRQQTRCFAVIGRTCAWCLVFMGSASSICGFTFKIWVAPSLFCTTQKEEEEVTKVLIKLGASSWNSNLPLQFGDRP